MKITLEDEEIWMIEAHWNNIKESRDFDEQFGMVDVTRNRINLQKHNGINDLLFDFGGVK